MSLPIPIHVKLLLLPLQDALFNRSRAHKSIDVNRTGLADAVHTPDGLYVSLRVPARISTFSEHQTECFNIFRT